MEWTGVPWADQETPHKLMYDAVYWNSVPRALFWNMYSSFPHIEAHILNHIIMADLLLHAIAENILLPNGCANASATRNGAKKLAIESHHDFTIGLKFLEEKPF